MKRSWLYATIVLATIAPRQAQADELIRAAAIGEPGGGSFEVLCPEGQILTALAIRAGAAIDAVAPVCVTALNAQQTRRDSLNAVMPYQGGTGGKEVKLDCPLGYPAVNGVGVQRERDARFVDGLSLSCKRADASEGRSGRDYDGVTEAERQRRYGDIRQYEWPPRSQCEKGHVAVGIYGRSNRLLEQFGLICSLPVIRNPSISNRASSIYGRRADQPADDASGIGDERPGGRPDPATVVTNDVLDAVPAPAREAQIGEAATTGPGSATSLNPQPLPPKVAIDQSVTTGPGSTTSLNPQPLPPKVSNTLSGANGRAASSSTMKRQGQ